MKLDDFTGGVTFDFRDLLEGWAGLATSTIAFLIAPDDVGPFWPRDLRADQKVPQVLWLSLSVCLSVRPSVCLSVCLSICPSLCLWLSVGLSVRQSYFSNALGANFYDSSAFGEHLSDMPAQNKAPSAWC